MRKKTFIFFIFFYFFFNIEGKAYSNEVNLKCITTKKEVNGKENNIITGKPNKLDEAPIFIKIDTEDKNAMRNERGIAWVYFNETGKRNKKKETYVTTDTINRFDLSRIEKTVKVSNEEASIYRKLWDKNKNEENFFQISKMIALAYLNITLYPKDNFGYIQEYQCEKVNKQF